MLADRHYMRDPEGHRTAVYKQLIIVLLACFVVQSILIFYAGIDLNKMFGLSRAGLADGKVWQIFTFQFLHSAPWPFHVLFNCLALFFFGRELEEPLGGRKLLTIYFVGGSLGGLLQVLVSMIFGFPPEQHTVGASAGVCALIATFCRMYPERESTFIFYFFPVTIRAKYLLWFLGGLSTWLTIFPLDSNVAHSAHLGGLLIGMAFVHNRWHEFAPWEEWLGRFKAGRPAARKEKPRLPVLIHAGRARPERPARPEPPAADYISKEVDPILDKISSQGIHSLTAREREILETARKKMSRR